MVDLQSKLNMSECLSLYGGLLTEHQAEMMRLYFDCDISLFEIAEQFNISRQAVRDAIVRGERTLAEIENKLRFKQKLDTTRNGLMSVIVSLQESEPERALRQAVKTLSNLEE